MRSRRTRIGLALAALLTAAGLSASAWRSYGPAVLGEGAVSPPSADGTSPIPSPPPARTGPLALPYDAIGWEEAAVAVAVDLQRYLQGRAFGGSYEEARAEAARLDLAAHPPEPDRLRRMLLSDLPVERATALAALAARPVPTDDLVRIVLRSARPEDDELLRLLAAEVVSALPPELLARHEDDLLRAFAREPNPLVLAVALPALERLEPERLRALVDAQLALASPQMLPVVVALARERLGEAGLREVGVTVSETGVAIAGGE
jgi:hypothetical protein